MHIVFCCDRRVLPGLHVAAYSLLDRFNESQPQPQITIFSDALNNEDIDLLHQTLETLNKPYSLNLHHIDTSKFTNFPSLNGSWATYYRLYAFQALDVERLLYIDADTLCDIDVSPLQYLDMGSTCVSWVPEAPLSDAIDQDVAKQIGKKGTKNYFNAGVMLVNVPMWKEQDISQRAMDYIATHRPIFHDQSALNVILCGNATELNPTFNCMSNMRKNWPYIKHPYGKIGRLIHFLDSPKPWDLMSEWMHPQYALWRSVLDKTAMKSFRSWHQTPTRKLPQSNKDWMGYKKSVKDRLLFFSYQKKLLSNVKGT